MKKIILVGFVVIVSVFAMIGCGKADNGDTPNGNEETTANTNQKITDEFKVGDVTFKFDKDAQFGNFNYKIVDGLEPDESQQAVYYDCDNKDIYDGQFVFRIGLLYSDETTLEEFLEGATPVSKEMNGINWSTASVNTTADDKETTYVFYAAEKDGVLYVGMIQIYRESNVDAEKLAEVFMNGVTIK